ncbi:MAG: 23S rRNA (uracil(1939)-C(5))-methyltransferase RlmD [Lachnospiraceae bacterium]|nr:23S rRNA (uracil(1939)-C(5))-methyltransferase RlmD [Lachnospiraceae bacterium]
MFKKNQTFTIEIQDIGSNGEGIGRIDGYTLFVKDAIPKDVVRIKITKANKNFGFAIIEEIISPSDDRVEPVCPVASKCGGCRIQHLSYQKQLEYKENIVKNNLERIGKAKDFVLHKIIGMDNPYFYRNKAQYPVRRGRDGQILMGFYAGRTHSVIETERCYIGTKENEKVLEIVKKHMEEYNIEPYDEVNHRGLVRHILIRKGFATGEIMVCIVINGRDFPNAENLVSKLLKIQGMADISLNVNTEKSNVILGKKIINLYGNGYITDMIGDVKFQISPLSFYQVNPVQTAKLYETALKYAGLTGEEIVWDMYCGIGTISLFLAKSAFKVNGVEVISEAIENARNNAKINGIGNVEFFVGKAEEVLPEYYEEQERSGGKGEADVIVVDPPRKGCDVRLCETIVKMQPERIVYVSCDSATLSRDVKYFEENGYRLREVQPVDMFPMTEHVETVVLIQKRHM